MYILMHHFDWIRFYLVPGLSSYRYIQNRLMTKHIYADNGPSKPRHYILIYECKLNAVEFPTTIYTAISFWLCGNQSFTPRRALFSLYHHAAIHLVMSGGATRNTKLVDDWCARCHIRNIEWELYLHITLASRFCAVLVQSVFNDSPNTHWAKPLVASVQPKRTIQNRGIFGRNHIIAPEWNASLAFALRKSTYQHHHGPTLL